jgi:hypothetical protein
MKTSLSLPLGSFQNYLSEPAFYFLLLTRQSTEKPFFTALRFPVNGVQ